MTCSPDPLDPLFAELRARPKLSAERLAELSRAVGSVPERNELIEATLPMVVGLAKRYAGAAELAELICAGSAALLDAAQGFDHTRGTKFSTWAFAHVRKAMFEVLRSSGAARASEHAHRLLAAEEDEAVRLAQALGREPTRDELDAALGWSDRTSGVAEHARQLRRHRADEEVMARLAADELDPEAELDRRRELERLRAALADVAPDGTRARALIDASLAEDDLDTIAAGLGLSRRQADQLLAGTLDRIRRGLHGPAPDQLGLFPAGPA